MMSTNQCGEARVARHAESCADPVITIMTTGHDATTIAMLPLHLAGDHIAAALLAGHTVTVSDSDGLGATALELGSIIADAARRRAAQS